MTEARKLLPCPFCGGEAFTKTLFQRLDRFLHAGDDYYSDDRWLVACRGCGCEVGLDDTEAEAISAWNLRDPAADGENERSE